MPDSSLPALTAAAALDGTELLYATQGGADRKATANQLTNSPLTIVDKGSIGTTQTVTFDVSAAVKQRVQRTGGTLTLAFSNWPASGKYGECEVFIVNGGSNILFSGTINWHVGDGTTSTTFANMGIGLATSGLNRVLIWTIDGGTTRYGRAI